MKIHISLETKILLDSIGGYILEPRGLIMVDVSRWPQKPHYYKDFPPRDMTRGRPSGLQVGYFYSKF